MTEPASPNSDGLHQLAHVSRQLGGNKAFVQGGGGNTSFKNDARCMWVKASGSELAHVSLDQGFVAVDYTGIRDGLSACESEADYTGLVRSAILPAQETSKARPSIEAGFHALLGPCVLHSHSVLTNLLACAKEGVALTEAILPQAVWVPYASPGLPVTQSVMEKIIAQQALANGIAILLLQNHGLVVAAHTPDEAWQLHEKVNETVRSHFRLLPPVVEEAPFCAADAEHLLFPDQAVYLGHETLRLSKAGEETQQAYNYLRQTMHELGLTPNFLPVEEADFLLNMEAEKYRQKVAKS